MLIPSSIAKLDENPQTANYTITNSDAFKTITNRGATAGLVFSFSNPVLSGMEVTVTNVSDYPISFLPNPGIQFMPVLPQILSSRGQGYKFICVSSTQILVQQINKGVSTNISRSFGVQKGARATHHAFIDGSGLIWSWGKGYAGSLGNSTVTDQSSPVSVVGGRSFYTFATATYATTALEYGTGAAWSWGYNIAGQLGLNNITNISSPQAVVGNNKFVTITGGEKNFSALDTSGIAWSWGFNNKGQLGNSSTANTSSPISVVGGKTFTTISCGVYNTHALDTAGAAWSWGYNNGGQLGNNSTVNASSPVSVVGGKSFATVAAGSFRVTALDSNGVAWTWGRNPNGALGTNNSTDYSSPVSVAGGRSFATFSVGKYHTLAIEKGTGVAWSWGQNPNGELGDGSITNRNSPVTVTGGKSFISVSAGANDSMALEAGTGIVWAWGAGSIGRLGNNNTVDASSPVSVARIFLG